MRPAYVANPVANVLFVITMVVWFLSELRQALRRRSNAATTDRNSLLLLRVCITLGVLFAAWALRLGVTAFGASGITLAIAFLLMWCGIALRWWSFHTLGRYFTFSVMTSADQPVITTGPYRWLRHPSYTGVLLALIGTGVAFGDWLSLAALVVLPLIGLLYRIHVEESALARTLGPLYTTYASTRKRIIPLVW
jgi:protein-S-isoprenylcysteine O-methyltransferase Ste14